MPTTSPSGQERLMMQSPRRPCRGSSVQHEQRSRSGGVLGVARHLDRRLAARSPGLSERPRAVGGRPADAVETTMAEHVQLLSRRRWPRWRRRGPNSALEELTASSRWTIAELGARALAFESVSRRTRPRQASNVGDSTRRASAGERGGGGTGFAGRVRMSILQGRLAEMDKFAGSANRATAGEHERRTRAFVDAHGAPSNRATFWRLERWLARACARISRGAGLGAPKREEMTDVEKSRSARWH